MTGIYDRVFSAIQQQDAFPDEGTINAAFDEICKKLEISNCDDRIRDLVIYEMIDGMRTSTNLSGIQSYLDGGIFAARTIYFLKMLGARACYVNVTEEKHALRDNYLHILRAMKQLYSFYEEFSRTHSIRCRFLGNPIAQSKETRLFMKELMMLEKRTAKNTDFLACFLINYSLTWAMMNPNIFATIPEVNVTIRHTKLQTPTSMLLPPSKSDSTSLVFIQQGASSATWSNHQMLCLIGIALRSMLMNYGTQYIKRYKAGENEKIRKKREIEAILVCKRLEENVVKNACSSSQNVYLMKRAILGTPFGFEIYEF